MENGESGVISFSGHGETYSIVMVLRILEMSIKVTMMLLMMMAMKRIKMMIIPAVVMTSGWWDEGENSMSCFSCKRTSTFE